MNFHSFSLVRNGRAALGLTQKEVPEDEWSLDFEDEGKRTMSPEEIDDIAGGEYWRGIVSSEMASFEMDQACAREYMAKMSRYFQGVRSYPIKQRYTHKIPKYRLIFGSRSPHAMLLINEAVCRARDQFLKIERVDDRLFDLRQDNEKHDSIRLEEAILTVLDRADGMKRRDLIVGTMESLFGEYLEKEYRNAIYALQKKGVLFSASGKTRFNDDEWLSTRPFSRGSRG